MKSEFEKMVKQLERELKNIDLEDIENRIDNEDIMDELCKIFDYSMRTVNLLNYKISLYYKNIYEYDTSLYQRIFDVFNKINNFMNISVEYMDINRNNFIAQRFYREFQSKIFSQEKINVFYESWDNFFGRKIKLDSLNDEEYKKALKITLYLRVLAIKSNMENLLDCLNYICRNCNFDKKN